MNQWWANINGKPLGAIRGCNVIVCIFQCQWWKVVNASNTIGHCATPYSSKVNATEYMKETLGTINSIRKCQEVEKTTNWTCRRFFQQSKHWALEVAHAAVKKDATAYALSRPAISICRVASLLKWKNNDKFWKRIVELLYPTDRLPKKKMAHVNQPKCGYFSHSNT